MFPSKSLANLISEGFVRTHSFAILWFSCSVLQILRYEWCILREIMSNNDTSETQEWSMDDKENTTTTKKWFVLQENNAWIVAPNLMALQ